MFIQNQLLEQNISMLSQQIINKEGNLGGDQLTVADPNLKINLIFLTKRENKNLFCSVVNIENKYSESKIKF